MLSVLLYKVLHEERIMVIDEIESSLHYELLSYFVRTFIASSETYSQILFTTHDLNLLNETSFAETRFGLRRKMSMEQVVLTRLPQYGLHKNVSPYNAYRQNKLARLPFVRFSIYRHQWRLSYGKEKYSDYRRGRNRMVLS